MHDSFDVSRTVVSRRLEWPLYGTIGLLLVATAWPLNWALEGARTHLLFFPLWLGFILTVDAAVRRRIGTSLIARAGNLFPVFFLASIPLWWLFEVLNARTDNWQYLSAGRFGTVEYAILASLAFSTVIPAVLEASELMNTFNWARRIRQGWRFPSARSSAPFLFAAGWLMLAAVLLWPDQCYPLLWGSLYALIDPVNVWLGRRSILARLERGDWSLLVTLSAGTLLCGFFWELWNIYSMPKWTYRTPGVEFWHIFEMPLLGYLGYIPFGWEVYAFIQLVLPDRIARAIRVRPDGVV